MSVSGFAAGRDGDLCVSIQSRECDPLLLENLPGSTFFPERPVGAAIVNALRRPGGSVVCVTAPKMEDAAAQIDYFVDLAASAVRAEGGEASADALRARVSVLSLDDPSPRWLSEKLLDPDGADAAGARAELVRRVRAARAAGGAARLAYFEPSRNLEALAEELGVPGDQAPAAFIPTGTKAAGRRLFAEEGIPLARGGGECSDLEGLTEAICELMTDSGIRRFVLKLSSTAYGGGLGNAVLDLTDMTPPAASDPAAFRAELAGAVGKRLATSRVLDGSLGWSGFQAAIPGAGVVAEEMLEGDDLRSPSYQGRIVDGVATTVSTHEQVLGANGQTYTGSAFPAFDGYRSELLAYGLRVGEALVRRGIDRGDYGVDFVAVRRGAHWRLHGCEINLRATGTLHGFEMATGLLGTVPDADGLLRARDGGPRVYLASDGIADPAYVGLRPGELIDLVRRSPLCWDQRRAQGVVLHMLSALPGHGKFGAVCVGVDEGHAADLMSRLRALVDRRAADATA